MADTRKPPDYNVSALVRGTEMKGNVGVAWKRDDGKISVKLDAFVVLNGGPDTFLTLFPRENVGDTGARRARPNASGGRGQDMDDDIPF